MHYESIWFTFYFRDRFSSEWAVDDFSISSLIALRAGSPFSLKRWYHLYNSAFINREIEGILPTISFILSVLTAPTVLKATRNAAIVFPYEYLPFTVFREFAFATSGSVIFMFEARKARERGHFRRSDGCFEANIDAIIETIKTSANPQEARETLTGGWMGRRWSGCFAIAAGSVSVRPDEVRVKIRLNHLMRMAIFTVCLRPKVGAILELRLHRWTDAEQDKVHRIYRNLRSDCGTDSNPEWFQFIDGCD